jgi:hypothetical protein
MYGIYDNGKIIARFVAPTKVISNKPVYVSDTLSLKRATFSRTAQRWEIESNLEPLVASANELFVSLVTKGLTETVVVLMPQNYGASIKRTATTALTGTQATASSSSIAVTGNTGTGFIPKGTFIKFSDSTHTKVYMTTSDLTGNGSVSIYPRLLKAVAGTFSYKDDVYMDCLYDTSVVIGMVYTDGILMDTGSIKLVERL